MSAGASPRAKPFAVVEGGGAGWSAEVCIRNLATIVTFSAVWCLRVKSAYVVRVYWLAVSADRRRIVAVGFVLYTLRPSFGAGYGAALPPQLADTNTG